MLKGRIELLEKYMVRNQFKGHDPYDGLMSPLFKLPFLRSNHTLRFLSQQLIKRSPFNLRPFLLIPPGENPVTLGLSIQAYTMLIDADAARKNYYETQVEYLLGRLEFHSDKTYHGDCWGYDFDWAARHTSIPAYKPTVVATGIIVNALFLYYQHNPNPRVKKLILSSADFVLKDLYRTIDSENDICLSYSPFDKQIVFNASLKGSRLLAQCYYLTKDLKYLEIAKRTMSFVMKNQREDGAWVYSKSKEGGWVDNYHTGYVLDCAKEYSQLTGDIGFNQQIQTGFEYYLRHFFLDSGMPKFYDKETYPIDCTSAAQSILTLVKFNKIELADKVANWMMKEMQDQEGYFYFRKFKHHTERQSFMRWSNAWMFAALSTLLKTHEN
ncbi:MAG: delta-aminolevulinic acid dehydratase [Bacteroidia bacterium]|nr:delta-aminolevulinic acid dehydratase [Bacteroidia bacterium]